MPGLVGEQRFSMVGDPNKLPAHSAADKPLGSAAPSGGGPPEGSPGGRHAATPGIPGPPSPDDNGAADFPFPETLLPQSAGPSAEDDGDAPLREGDLCKGRVVGILPSGVAVDFGRKTEGLVAIEEFADGSDLPQIGDDIDVIFQNRGSAGDYASLSYQSARRMVLWDGIEQAYRDRRPVPARVVSTVSGGLGVDIGLPAFLPSSQIDLRPPADVEALVGTEFAVQVVKFSRSRGNIVVSRRVLLEEEIRRQKTATLAKISLGAVVSGTVKNLTSYGAFVDLGGIDALLHITDLSYSRVNDPSDIVQVGESISAKVIKFDAERECVSLSLKALEPDPWEGSEDRYKPGERVSGRVTRIVEFGVFLEIEKGLEGLLHVDEISWSKRPPPPSKQFKVGQTVDCVVLKVESAKRRLSLSVKALTPDPWTTVAERYPTGTIVDGRVRSMTYYGAFIELEEGVEALLHVTDLTRDSKVRHPKDLLKKGRSVQAVVLHVDEEAKRIALGMKQLEPDAWDDFFASHFVGDVIEARVLRRTSFGVFVEAAPGLEALCHATELGGGGKRKGKGGPDIGHVYRFRILDMDDLERRLRLSRRGLPTDEVKPPEDVRSAPETGAAKAEAAPKPRKSSKRKRKRPKKMAASKPPKPEESTAQATEAEPTVVASADQPETPVKIEAESPPPSEQPEPAEAASPEDSVEAVSSPRPPEPEAADKENARADSKAVEATDVAEPDPAPVRKTEPEAEASDEAAESTPQQAAGPAKATAPKKVAARKKSATRKKTATRKKSATPKKSAKGMKAATSKKAAKRTKKAAPKSKRERTDKGP